MNTFTKSIAGTLILGFFSTGISAQTDSTRRLFIKNLADDIFSTYVSPGVAKKMYDSLCNRFPTGLYDTTLNTDEFAYEVTKYLRRLSSDRHITITAPHGSPHYYTFHERSFRQQKKWMARYKKRTGNDMFTYGEIRILPGNIGYMELKDFGATAYEKKANRGRIKISTVMHFLRNINSVIIDLRDNLGGSVQLAAMFCSYFADTPHSYFISTEEVVRFNTGSADTTYVHRDKIYTSDKITNRHTKNKSIYILTSARTFSAAELTIYKIKQFFPTAITLGEKTTGGGNGLHGGFITQYYMAVIPSIKIYDEANYDYSLEAKGIIPDIPVSEDSAFAIAYKLALIPGSGTAHAGARYFKKKWPHIDDRGPIYQKSYTDFPGNYRKIVVSLEMGKLYMIYDAHIRHLLVPDAPDFFLAEGMEFVRFRRNNDNIVTEIQVKYKDGYLERFRKL